MSHTHSMAASLPNFQPIVHEALKAYNLKRRAKNGAHVHPLATRLQACNSPSSFLELFEEQIEGIDQSLSGHVQWTEWTDLSGSTVNSFAIMVATLGLFSPVCPRTCAYLESALSYLFGRYFSYFYPVHS